MGLACRRKNELAGFAAAGCPALIFRMDNIRFFFKTALFLLLSAGLAPLYILILLTFYPFRERIGPRLVQFYSRLCLWIFSVEIEQVETERRAGKSQKGLIIISNHASFLDIFVISALFGSIFLSKAEVKRYPVIGQIAWLMGVIFFDRSSPEERTRVLRKISKNDSPRPISVFPQGTTGRIIDGLPFNRGIFKAAQLASNISLLPVTILYKKDREIAWHKPQSLLENARNVFAQKEIKVKVIVHKLLTSDSCRGKTAEAICKQVEGQVLGQLQKE